MLFRSRLDRLDARQEKTDKQIAALRKIILAGARELFKLQRENARQIESLTTELRRFERDLLRPGGNGGRPRR